MREYILLNHTVPIMSVRTPFPPVTGFFFLDRTKSSAFSVPPPGLVLLLFWLRIVAFCGPVWSLFLATYRRSSFDSVPLFAWPCILSLSWPRIIAFCGPVIVAFLAPYRRSSFNSGPLLTWPCIVAFLAPYHRFPGPVLLLFF